MNNFQIITDKAAIGLSVLCAFHCLALPIVLVLMPSMAALGLDNEAFHLWMVLAVIPLSVYALTLGCRQHKKAYLLVCGLVGVLFLISAVVWGESFFGEALEKTFTIIGAAIIAFGHIRNYRLCQNQDKHHENSRDKGHEDDRENCACHDSRDEQLL